MTGDIGQAQTCLCTPALKDRPISYQITAEGKGLLAPLGVLFFE